MKYIRYLTAKHHKVVSACTTPGPPDLNSDEYALSTGDATREILDAFKKEGLATEDFISHQTTSGTCILTNWR